MSTLTIVLNVLAVSIVALGLIYYKTAVQHSLENYDPSIFTQRITVPTLKQALIFPAYVLFLAVAGFLVPGYYHKGTPALDKKVYSFKINGLRLLIALLMSLAAGVHFNLFKPTIIYDNFVPIFITVNFSALLLSTVLYVKGVIAGYKGSVVEGFVMGTELMPHLFGINVKFFWLRPAMMGWLLINLSLAAKHLEIVGFISTPMLLYQIFSLIYVVDYFWFEEYMTSTWDIIAENFGLMLVWGDIVWIPFVFSIQAWYLLEDSTVLNTFQIAGMVIVFLLGYFIFRGCNKQKHDFKHNPKKPIWGKPPVAIGGRLLISGWWGFARHFNYTGDIILGISFSLPCRFNSIVPWVYPIYLTILLIQRERRDDNKCREKYKELWNQYCKAVPYRMIPYVY